MKLIEIYFGSKPKFELYDIVSETEKTYVYRAATRNLKNNEKFA